MKKYEKNILKKSRSTLFDITKLPKKYRDDVSKLYSFLHLTKSYSDANNLNTEGFKYIVRRWQAIKKDNLFGHYEKVDDSIAEKALANIAYLVNRYDINTRDVDDYLRSVAIELRNKPFHSAQEMARYLQLSAEAPASMLSKVMQLPNALTHNAKMQGRALKYMQMLFNIINDNEMGRCYFPMLEVKKFGLISLDAETIKKHPKEFNEFVQLQIKRYQAWQEEAIKGYVFMPKKLKRVVYLNQLQNNSVISAVAKNPSSLLYGAPKKGVKVKASARLRMLARKQA